MWGNGGARAYRETFPSHAASRACAHRTIRLDDYRRLRDFVGEHYKTLSQAWKCSRQYPRGLAAAETVLVGESGAMSIMNALDAAGFVIVSKEALKAGSDGYG
jgi:hypothetical protein